MWHCSLGDPLATCWRGDYIGPHPSWKGQCFVLIGIDAYSGYRLAFPAYNVCAKTLTRELADTLFTSMVWHRGIHFIVSEVRRWVPALGIHRSYHVPHHPQAAGSTEQWDARLKTQSQHQPGGSLAGLAQGSPEGCLSSESPVYGDVYHTASIHESKSQG